MTDDTCPRSAAPLDAWLLTQYQVQDGAPQVSASARSRLAQDPERFGQPSNYSLPGWHLARHVRQLRQSGWQAWELRARFTFWNAA
jgi:hypothetical protein